MGCDIQEIMVAIFSCHAVLCILVAPVWSSPVPSSKVADRKTLNPVRNAAVVASLSRERQMDAGWSTDSTEGSSTTSAPDLLPVAKPGSSVATNILENLMQNNNAVHMAFEGEAPQENYANLPYTPIIDYAFMTPGNGTANGTPNWQDTLANVYRNPAFQNGSIVKLPPIKIVGAGSESKFPFILEIFAQRIQAMFSTYAHEDLSRPPTYDSNSTLYTNKTTSTTPKTTLQTSRKPTATTKKPPITTTKISTKYPNRITATTLKTTTLQTTRKPTQTPTTKPPPRTTRTTKKVTRVTTRATTRKPTHTTTKIFSSAALDSTEDIPNRSEEIDITYVKPISVENDTYIYVGDGDDEFDRGIHRRKP